MKETKKRKFNSSNKKKLSLILSITILLTLFSFSLTQEEKQQPSSSEAVAAEAVKAEPTNAENSSSELEKKIEQQLKENIGKENDGSEKVDLLDKYQNFNLTQKVEEQYQDDKNSDYFNNVDDLDKSEKYSKKEKKKTKKELEEEKYNKEWDEKVSKMHAHDLLTLRVNKKDFEIFYEEIEQVPVTITCAFYLHEEKGKIDFDVLDPKRKSLFKLRSKSRGFYEFEVKERGKYEFHLNNERVSSLFKLTKNLNMIFNFYLFIISL